jgi:hypothetical protein
MTESIQKKHTKYNKIEFFIFIFSKGYDTKKRQAEKGRKKDTLYEMFFSENQYYK